MNLKEAFAYRNYLSSMFNELKRNAMSTDAFCVVKEEHLKSKANPGADDEFFDSRSGTLQSPISIYEAPGVLSQVDPEKIVEVLFSLESEIEALDEKICDAKASQSKNIDVLVATNKHMRQIVDVLNAALMHKTSETRSEAIAYKIIESGEHAGEQVAYRYPVRKVTTIDFDRNKLKKLAGRYSDEVEARSYEIDGLMLTINIDHDPRFSKSDTLQDIIDSVG